MDDRVALRRRHLQLGPRLLDKRPLFGAGNLRLRKTHSVSLLSNGLPSGGSVAFQATVFVPAATHPRPATDRSLARDRGVCPPRSGSKHSSITTTFDRYGHLLPGMDEALAEETDGVGRAALVRGNR
jgi:hypothetical protein